MSHGSSRDILFVVPNRKFCHSPCWRRKMIHQLFVTMRTLRLALMKLNCQNVHFISANNLYEREKDEALLYCTNVVP